MFVEAIPLGKTFLSYELYLMSDDSQRWEDLRLFSETFIYPIFTASVEADASCKLSATVFCAFRKRQNVMVCDMQNIMLIYPKL